MKTPDDTLKRVLSERIRAVLNAKENPDLDVRANRDGSGLSQSARALRFEKGAGRSGSRDARLRGLRNIARQVFVDRNASGWNNPGMPKGDRLAIKAEARPFLREAIHWVRKSRNALMAGDVEMHELLRDRARMYRAFAALEFFQPYANRLGERYKEIAQRSASGGKATRKISPDDEAALKEKIRGFVARGDQMLTKEWAYQLNVSVDTIERRIREVRAESEGG